VPLNSHSVVLILNIVSGLRMVTPPTVPYL